MVGFLRRNVCWLILAAGTVGVPYFSLSDSEVSWSKVRGPYSSIDMGGEIQASVDPVVAGSGVGNLVYTVTATNYGPDAADTAYANVGWNLFPAAAIVDSITVSTGTYTHTTSIDWDIGPLAIGQGATMTIVITVGADIPAVEYFDMVCFFYSEGSDPNSSNDYFYLTTDVAGVIRVDADAAPSGNGLSWATARNDLATVFFEAGKGDELWVKNGVYFPDQSRFNDDDRAPSFVLKNGVEVYGGFKGNETQRNQRNPRSRLTILSGDIDGNDVVDSDGVTRSWTDLRGVNANHVITSTGTDTSAVVDGFVVTGGWAAAASGEDSRGAAISCDGATPTLGNLYVVGNRSATQAAFDLCMSEVMNSVFDSNYAGDSGAVSNGARWYSDCVFRNNSAANDGSVIYVINEDMKLTNCRIQGNSANSSGAIFARNVTITLTNVLFSGNEAGSGAALDIGGSTNAVLNNITVSGNQCIASGGAITTTTSGSVVVRNSVFWNNVSPPGTPILESSISHPGTGSVTVISTLLQGSGGSGAWSGAPLIDGGGNIDVDPLFLEAISGSTTPTTRGNYRITIGSPAMDVGNNAFNPTPYDLDGNLRILDGIIDLGAYEGHMIFGDDLESGTTGGWAVSVP